MQYRLGVSDGHEGEQQRAAAAVERVRARGVPKGGRAVGVWGENGAVRMVGDGVVRVRWGRTCHTGDHTEISIRSIVVAGVKMSGGPWSRHDGSAHHCTTMRCAEGGRSRRNRKPCYSGSRVSRSGGSRSSGIIRSSAAVYTKLGAWYSTEQYNSV